jgi:hypothetical protein
MVVNNGTADQSLRLDLEGFPASAGALVPYRTSPSENLKKLDDLRSDDGVVNVRLRGQSVTTFIPKRFELPAMPDIKDVFSTYLAAENDGQSRGLHVLPMDDELAGWAQGRGRDPRCANVPTLRDLETDDQARAGGESMTGEDSPYSEVFGRRIVEPSRGDAVAPVPYRAAAQLPTAQQAALVTLTTCHPEFSDRERMIVHGVLVNQFRKAPGSDTYGQLLDQIGGAGFKAGSGASVPARAPLPPGPWRNADTAPLHGVWAKPEPSGRETVVVANHGHLLLGWQVPRQRWQFASELVRASNCALAQVPWLWRQHGRLVTTDPYDTAVGLVLAGRKPAAQAASEDEGLADRWVDAALDVGGSGGQLGGGLRPVERHEYL